MQLINRKNIKEVVAILAIALTVFVSGAFANPKNDAWQTELPAQCSSIQVPAGNNSAFRVYAIGVQIYRWDGSAWIFVAPSANLYADEGYNGKVGLHYAGPTWESNNGGKVVAARVPNTGCTPDADAIPWLLLKTVSTQGAGIFNKVTYIQRLKMMGGLAPTVPGTTVGEEKRMPYTAEYYFYRGRN